MRSDAFQMVLSVGSKSDDTFLSSLFKVSNLNSSITPVAIDFVSVCFLCNVTHTSFSSLSPSLRTPLDSRRYIETFLIRLQWMNQMHLSAPASGLCWPVLLFLKDTQSSSPAVTVYYISKFVVTAGASNSITEQETRSAFLEQSETEIILISNMNLNVMYFFPHN